MLNFNNKIDILKTLLFDVKDNYADSFKTDIIFYFDQFENIQENDIKFNFLNNLNSKEEILNWLNNLTSNIVLKYNESEMQLSDFIFYSI